MQECSDDAEWHTFVQKGHTLLRMMQSDQAGAGALCNPPKASSQSNHNSFPVEFDKWGYKFYDDDGRTSLDRYYYGLETTLPAIGASLCQKDWKFWKITHGNYRTTNPHINGQTYPAPTDGHQQKRVTGALFVLPVHAQSGTLIIAKQFSAQYEATWRKPPVADLPDLKSTADVAYGAFAMTPGHNPLNHIFTWAVTNEPTKRAIMRAVHSIGKQEWNIKGWPGLEFGVSTDAGRALLGSPCGASVGYLLATHKSPLGNLAVVKIRIFMPDSLAFQYDVDPISIYWQIGRVG